MLFAASHHALNFMKDCGCEDHCEQCAVVFRIDVKCNDEYRTITTRDLVAQNNEKLEAVHFSSGLYVDATLDLLCFDHLLPFRIEQEQTNLGQDLGIAIAKLSKGQELKCECIAMKVAPP
jgi:hypothetical protein